MGTECESPKTSESNERTITTSIHPDEKHGQIRFGYGFVGYGWLLCWPYLSNIWSGLHKCAIVGPTNGRMAYTVCSINPRAGRAGKE